MPSSQDSLLSGATSLFTNYAHLAAGLVHLCYATATQPAEQRDNHSKSDLPDTSELKSHLQQEWHPDNNVLLSGVTIKPHSHRRVLWSCLNCPAGCPHIWLAAVFARTKGAGCPYCCGRKLCKHNSLATKAPMVARYWDHRKNASTPEQTLAGSGSRADWKCPDCGHEWQTAIAKKVFDGSGCPRCRYSSGNYSKHPTFQAVQHTLLQDWDHDRNAKDGIHPDDTTLKSKKLVHWVCHKCPKGQLHRYQMRPYKRTGRRPRGCPYCASQKICDCNSLAACEPTIAAEWDVARNEGSPADVTSRSNKVVWWKNERRGSWQQHVFERTTPRKIAH